MKVTASLQAGLWLASGAAALAPVGVLAQAVGTTAAPPTRDELNRPEFAPAPAPPARVSVEGQAERPPCPLDEPRFQDIRVTISDVRFDGLKALSADALRPSWASFAGSSQPISVVCSIRDAAASILRDQGYLAAVQVPPQTIENGQVRFDVLMGRLVSVHIRGDAGPAERTLASYMERIKAQEVFNTREAERYLLLARELPGYDVRLVLKPAGTAPGELIGDVLVTRRTLDVDLNVQNYGSKEVGRFGGLVRATLYGLTGLADRTTLSAYSTADFEEQQIYQIAHDFRLGPEGLSLGGRLAYALTRPGIADLNDQLKAKTLLATIEAGYGIVKSQASSVTLSGGLDLVDQKVRFGGTPINEDKLRVLFARLSYDAIDRASLQGGADYTPGEPRWRLAVSLELRKGLDVLGASKGCGRTGAACAGDAVAPVRVAGDPEAAIIRFAGITEYRPAPKLTLALAARAQYASKPLFSFEEFTGGNYTIGRGYDPGTLAGDRGFGVQAEVRFGSLRADGPRALAFQPFAFVDSAWVWNEDALPRRIGDRTELYTKDSLASVGGGVRASYGNRLVFDVALAAPMKRSGPNFRKGDVRGLMSVTLKLWPWNRD